MPWRRSGTFARFRNCGLLDGCLSTVTDGRMRSPQEQTTAFDSLGSPNIFPAETHDSLHQHTTACIQSGPHLRLPTFAFLNTGQLHRYM